MNKQEKINFVKLLTDKIAEKIITQIQEDRIPEEWAGLELRALVALRADLMVYKMQRSQKIKFNNTVIVNNLC